ncbi:YfgM family protein [Alcanivorax quisquiliarum]|uniref:Ancillary SecYEG translocon subunit n=1 Tax=Alcanivorax quisquiliarum TaxID=2933565 RepID=A0ABT0E7H9_9GAMM|nr:tetratricopeptide repeat protein [Alcanivorax quisquiliarum]
MYSSEEEQVAALKNWWENNGKTLLVSLLIAIAVLVGWRQWSASRLANAAEASMVYERMMTAIANLQGVPDEQLAADIRQPAEILRDEYPRTVYAGQAGLALARLAVAQGDYDQAKAALNDVIRARHTDALEYTARVRLARVLVQTGETDAALAQLDGNFPSAWAGEVAEVRGDALRLGGRLAEARNAYDSALEQLQAGDSARERVRMKLEDIAPAS